jgi:hypothetical protein
MNLLVPLDLHMKLGGQLVGARGSKLHPWVKVSMDRISRRGHTFEGAGNSTADSAPVTKAKTIVERIFGFSERS